MLHYVAPKRIIPVEPAYSHINTLFLCLLVPTAFLGIVFTQLPNLGGSK
eukprot:gene5167-3715_t